MATAEMRTFGIAPSGYLPRSERSARLFAACLVVLCTFAVLVDPARADLDVGGAGSGAAQYRDPQSVAVDRSNGTVYVADTENRRVDVFDATGTFLRAFGWGVADGISNALQTCTSTCFPGIAGDGSGAFRRIRRIAVDNDPASPSHHHVYVFDGSDPGGHPELVNLRIQSFSPSGEFLFAIGREVNLDTGENLCTAASGDACGKGEKGSGPGQFESENAVLTTGPGGVVYAVEESRLQKFSPLGEFESQVNLPPGGLAQPTGVAVDSSGAIFVITGGATGAVRKYDPSGATVLSTFQSSFNLSAIGIDSADNLFVADNTVATPIFKYDASGTLRSVIYGTLTHKPLSVAPYPTAGGAVFAVESSRLGSGGNGVVYVAAPPPGPVVLKGSASAVGNVKATLNAQINPEGTASTYHFEYIDDEHFQSGEFANPATVITAESPSIGDDFSLYSVATPVTGLTPDTTYHFRAVASSSDGSNPGPAETFKTLPPLVIGDTWATDVAADTATVHVKANPLGLPATGYFEYVDDATYQGSGFTNALTVPDVKGGAASIALGSGEVEIAVSAQPFPLESGTLYHYRFVGSNAAVPAVIGPEGTFRTFRPRTAEGEGCANQAFRTGVSATLTDCRAYEMVSPLDKGNGDIITALQVSGYPTAYQQAATSGEGLTYSSFRAFGEAQSAPYSSQYLATRGSTEWSTKAISPPQGISEGTPSSLDSQFLAATVDLSSGWFLHDTDPPLTGNAPAEFKDIYRRDSSSGTFEAMNTVTPPHPSRPFDPVLQGISANGTHSVFTVNDNLTPNASTLDVTQVYEQSKGGALRLVSVLPNGKASKVASTAGSSGHGSGVVQTRSGGFTHALSDDGTKVYWSTDDGHLYLRQNADKEQSVVAGGVCTEPEKACTLTVAEGVNGSEAGFQIAAADGSRALYTSGEVLSEFNLENKSSTPIAASVLGLLGASEDATRVYFVSTAALTGGATAGKGNLYLHEAGGPTTFITSLSTVAPDSSSFRREPFARASRVSPDGRHVAFVSSGRLTGYDNTDGNTGKADIEVYTYEAGGNLLCVSCNPTGGRPVGQKASDPMIVRYGKWDGVAAFIPGWQTPFYASRALSADGSRLFFNSFDALALADTNGRMDVYQWEAVGSGTCVESSGLFSEENGGCVSLVSSGESPGDSEFVDASPDGKDVFFTTESSLLPQDYGLVDIYDAREEGGYPAPPSRPSSCEGEACQGPLAAPDDPTPASSTFEGAGNLPIKARSSCTKGKVRRKGRCVSKRKSARAHKRHHATHVTRGGRRGR